MVSGQVDTGTISKVLDLLEFPKGVSYSKVLSLLPKFLSEVRPLISQRTEKLKLLR